MDMNEKDKLGQDKRNDDGINFHSPGTMSSDWQFPLPTDSQLALCRRDLAGASPCSSASMINSFGPQIWEHPSNSQNLGFPDMNVNNNPSSSNPTGTEKVTPTSLRTGIDVALDMGIYLPNPMLKSGMFLPNAPLMLPQSLSQFPADSAFIERAARFSSFSSGNFSDMLNPFGVSDTMGLYSRGGGMMPGSEVFSGSGLKSISGGQAQENVVNVDEAHKDVSMSVDHLVTEDSPHKTERRGEGLVRSHDDGKQGVDVSGNESNETESSGGVGCQAGPSIMEGNGGDVSTKSLGSKKRKRNGQDTELDQAAETQQLGDVAKDNLDTQQKAAQNPISNMNKNTGKQGKQGSQNLEPPKEEYIHVRARRGQATNSHSLAERVRREKISERMKFLQDLVPGCSKVTGKAVMLDEIINYVQSLQRQVEFLSMKLATVNPRLDFNIEGLLSKDILQSRAVPSSTLPFSSELPMVYQHLHPSQSGLLPATFPGMESQSDLLRRTVNPHLTAMSAGFKEPSQLPNMWEDELHNVVQVNYGTSAPQDNQDMNGLTPDHMKVEL